MTDDDIQKWKYVQEIAELKAYRELIGAHKGIKRLHAKLKRERSRNDHLAEESALLLERQVVMEKQRDELKAELQHARELIADLTAERDELRAEARRLTDTLRVARGRDISSLLTNNTRS